MTTAPKSLNYDDNDPRGLIRESYVIEGISSEECRSIFFDWAMSVPAGEDSKTRIQNLLKMYQDANRNHPMTEVLLEGLEHSGEAKRRGGARGRARPEH